MRTLIVIAPDGEWRREGEFESVESAWDRADDMGSRWFFYPICIVTTGTSDSSKIASVPHGMANDWIGKTFKKLCEAIASDPEHACDYANGKTPFCILP